MSEQTKLMRRIARSIFGEEAGCTDSNCFYGYTGGMATNGGCRCVEQDPIKAAKRMRKIAYELACARHWEERNRDLVRENEVLHSNSDYLSSENASLSSQVESMAMRIESIAEELAKPEDVRLREVLDALDGRAVIFDGLGARVGHLLDEMDEWIERAGAAERRLKKAEDVVLMARQLTAYAWEDRLEDCEVSDSAKHDSRELSTAVWLYDQEAKS